MGTLKDNKAATISAVNEILKKYGNEAIVSLTEGSVNHYEVISTGSAAIDRLTGIGGLPRGRISEIYGPFSSGKSTFCMHVIAEAQRLGLKAAYVDVEYTFAPEYAKAIGMKLGDEFLTFSQPSSGEMALDVVEVLAASGEYGIIVVDSIAQLSPMAEMEGEMGDHNIGTQAKLLKRAMRKIVPVASKSNTAILLTNHITYKPGVMYGSPETTPGGTAVPFAASMRFDIRRRDAQKEGKETVGNVHHVKCIKNKCAPPFLECDVKIVYGEGFSKEESLIDEALDAGILVQSGAWISYNGDNIGQGVVKTATYLKENPEVARLITDTLASLER